MKISLFVLFFFIISKTMTAQSLEREVIASTGDYIENSYGFLSFTVGEATIQLAMDGTHILTQGFQQPYTNVVIPVEFGDFSIQKQDKFVKLNWFTYSERNSLRFDIERSDDAKSFSKIAEMKAIGASAVRHDYNAFDKSPLEGINYYRLRQIDVDGRESFSKTLSIYFDNPNNPKNWAHVFPTSVTNEVVIECLFNNDAQLTITNILGIPIRQWAIKKVSNPFQQTLLIGDLPNGSYFFIFKTSDTQIVHKIIKQ